MWKKEGLVVGPDPGVIWLAGGSGPCCAMRNPADPGVVDLYLSGRDDRNRSRIGLARFDVRSERLIELHPEPVLSLGTRGAFDENGTSYPSMVLQDSRLLMYYTGWIQGVHVPWYNDLGLAESSDGLAFTRVSRAPIMPRNNRDYIGIGSSCVMRDEDGWRMWYTRFDRWGNGPQDHPHYYNIKHARSRDGLDWSPDPGVCIDFRDASEYAVAKPCVLKVGNRFVMWYSWRGAFYRPGLATSEDGIHWVRKDEDVGIDVSASGWDSEMLCYPHVIDVGDRFFMFYNGNKYGTLGLGFAWASRESVMEMIYG